MTKQSITSEIQVAIEQIYRQWGVFSLENRIPENDELDMLKSKLMKLHDKINHLQLLESVYAYKQPIQEVITETVQKPITQTVIEKSETEQKITIEAPEVKTFEPIIAEVTEPTPIKPEVHTATTTAEEVKQKKVTASVVPPVQTARAEVFKEADQTVATMFHETETIHDKIGVAQPAFAIADKLKLSPVTDLVKAIGINEKFLFISQLFNDDSIKYQSAIDKLNTSSNFAEAYMYFDSEITSGNQIDKNSDACRQFVDLLQRRFM